MPYRHYGNIGDIWKHLPLCEILVREPPRVYIEANTAGALYALEGTSRQRYGVYTIYGADEPEIAQSAYLAQLRQLNKGGVEPRVYPGSPALALRLLGAGAARFVFFDLEPAALEAVRADAAALGLAERVELRCEDSIQGVHDLLDGLGPDSFITIDPYLLLEPNGAGMSYLDVFLAAARRGIPALAWYGYMTAQEQRELRERIRLGAAALDLVQGGRSLFAAEIWLAGMGEAGVRANPGIAGCGILTANLTVGTQVRLVRLADALCRLYAGMRFEGESGALMWALPLQVPQGSAV